MRLQYLQQIVASTGPRSEERGNQKPVTTGVPEG